MTWKLTKTANQLTFNSQNLIVDSPLKLFYIS